MNHEKGSGRPIVSVGLAAVLLGVMGLLGLLTAKVFDPGVPFVAIGPPSEQFRADALACIRDVSLEAEALADRWTLHTAAKTTIEGETMDVFGIDERYFSCYGAQIIEGRTFLTRDIEDAEFVAVLSESASFSLLRIVYGVGQRVVLGDHSYRVVGVVADDRAVGANAHRIYIPLTIAAAQPHDAVSLSACPKPAARQAGAALLSIARVAIPGARAYALERERACALLPVLLLVSGLAFSLCVQLTRAAMRGMKDMGVWVKGQLRYRYWDQMLGRLMLRLLIVLGLAASALLGYAALAHGLSKLWLLFPEWIPADTESALSHLLMENARSGTPVLYIPPAMHRLRILGEGIRWTSFILLALGVCPRMTSAFCRVGHVCSTPSAWGGQVENHSAF
ncbi:ABC transporter permease [Bacillota bacterium Meth-B3]